MSKESQMKFRSCRTLLVLLLTWTQCFQMKGSVSAFLQPLRGISVPARGKVVQQRLYSLRCTAGDTDFASSFLFSSCQAGAEKLLKSEVLRMHPELRFAYSRPGLVTFKNSSANAGISPSVSIRSSFSRVHGASVGQAATVLEVCELAQQVSHGRPLCLHVWSRDLGAARAAHPLAVRERETRIAALRRELLACGPTDLWSSSSVADEGERVLSVITGDEGDKYFVGLHTHSSYESVPLRPGSAASEKNGVGSEETILRRAHVPHAGGE